MEYNKELIKEYLLTTSSSVINQGNKYLIKVDGKQMEIGKCRLGKEIDIISCYDIVYYIKFNMEYIYIGKEDFSNERIVNIVYDKIDDESIITFEIEKEEEKTINNVDAISNNVLLDIIETINQESCIRCVYFKHISIDKLIKMINGINPYIDNSYPIKIYVGKDEYEFGIGYVDKEIDYNDLYERCFYIEKNLKVEYLKDNDYMSNEEIELLVSKYIDEKVTEVELRIDEEFMNGIESRLIYLNEDIYCEVYESNNKYKE